MEENIVSISDPADTIREALELAQKTPFGVPDAYMDSLRRLDAICPEALAALDRLVAREAELEAERDRLRHFIDCADTPMMRDVLAAKGASEARVQQLKDALRAEVGKRFGHRDGRAFSAEEIDAQIHLMYPALESQ